jgi:hypothetical protein
MDAGLLAAGGTVAPGLSGCFANDEHAVTLATVHAGRARPAAGTPWRLYLHITDGKPTEVWRKA